MSSPNLKTHTIPPKPSHPHTHTIILLHGRDSTAPEFASELFESEASPSSHPTQPDQDLTLPALLPSIKWVFPSAPLLHSTRFDTPLSQWFDIWSVENPDERPDLQNDGLMSSISALGEIVRAEERLVGGGRGRIFLGGVSQGFAVVLGAVFRGMGERFAGLVGVCSWLPVVGLGDGGFLEGIEQVRDFKGNGEGGEGVDKAAESKGLPLEVWGTFKSTPIFIGHCEDDEVVPVENGERMYRIIVENLGFTAVKFVKYIDGGHWVNEPKGVDDIVAFVRENM